MSEVQDASIRYAAKLAGLLTQQELWELIELIEADEINQDLSSALWEEADTKAGT